MAKVKMYTTASCAFCRAEKEFFKEHNIEFTEVAVDTDPAAADEMIELSGQMGVPYTVITADDGTTQGILGFDQPRLKAALAL